MKSVLSSVSLESNNRTHGQHRWGQEGNTYKKNT